MTTWLRYYPRGSIHRRTELRREAQLTVLTVPVHAFPLNSQKGSHPQKQRIRCRLAVLVIVSCKA